MAFTLRPATVQDVAATTDALADAFAQDPLMGYFFGAHPDGQRAATRAFFTLLMRVRLAIGAPVILLEDDGVPRGLVMGYDTAPADWPEALDREWAAFEARSPGIVERFDRYEQASARFEPPVPHWYLGVIGVHPSLAGRGAGRMLMEAFCAKAAADPLSSGVYLETSSPASLAFYRKLGFEVRGEGELDGLPLWCVFRAR